MAITFTTTDRAACSNGVKVLVHGRAGSGKTPLCATAPAPLIISAEAGLLSLRNVSIPCVEVHSLAEFDEAYKFCAYSEHARQFETICLDSITEIADVTLNFEKGRSKDPRRAYGEMNDLILARLRWFRDLPKNIYFSAKQGRVKDEMSGQTVYGVMMPGQQLGPQTPYLFDEVFSLEVYKGNDGNSYNYLRTQRDPQYECRDRSGTLEAFEKPDLTHIFNKIRSGQLAPQYR